MKCFHDVLLCSRHFLCWDKGVVRWADGVKLDEIPAGHLIQPRVGDIKSRYFLPAKHESKPSGKSPQFQCEKLYVLWE